MIWTQESGDPITPLQQHAAQRAAAQLTNAGSKATPVLSQDGDALVAVAAADPTRLAESLAENREAAGSVPGATVHLAGPATAQADLEDAFARTDGVLLAVALGGVVLILLLVYRSVLMVVLVIASALLSLATACAALYAGASAGWLMVDGQVQGIVFVLVIGASTDYALLLVARYREEAGRREGKEEAMPAACRATAPPVLASAATVACAMLTLTLATLPADRGLGPAVAIAMACCAVTSLTFLPAALVLCGPRALRSEAAPGQGDGLWERPVRVIQRHPRRTWLICLALLVAGAALSPMLEQDGVPLHRALPSGTTSVVGQDVLARHFAGGTASPLLVVAPLAEKSEVSRTVAATPGIAAVSADSESSAPGLLLATLKDPPDSPEARSTVGRLRTSLAGSGALVGGQAAQLTDIHDAAARDHRLIMPLVLGVVLLVLIVLLRCLLLPLLLVAAAWVSLFAAFGAAAVVLRLFWGSSTTEPAVVLFSFVFLVALGVDYNVFLVHRVRQEALASGTAAGVREGLLRTGGVITAAGLVLAATFAALGVMPLLYLAQIGLIVGVGVLVDSLLVRVFLVPALMTDLGSRVWWPSRMPGDRVPASVSTVPGPAGTGAGTEVSTADKARA
ncbi:MMPL family transporter [Streptomyces sp. NPDC048330]|uniref:MMPL family transporter n=1 Tax=Streptomyces sp. NPDC048330 TaxID=3365533 RepID=UPI00370F8B91